MIVTIFRILKSALIRMNDNDGYCTVSSFMIVKAFNAAGKPM